MTKRNRTSIICYFSERCPPRLPDSEIPQLVSDLRGSDPSRKEIARRKLVESHMGLAISLVGVYFQQRPHLKWRLDDTLSEAILELNLAVDAFADKDGANNIGGYINSRVTHRLRRCYSRDTIIRVTDWGMQQGSTAPLPVSYEAQGFVDSPLYDTFLQNISQYDKEAFLECVPDHLHDKIPEVITLLLEDNSLNQISRLTGKTFRSIKNEIAKFVEQIEIT